MENDFRSKSLKEVIPKIYKRSFLDAALFGFIRGQIKLLPSLSIEQSINQFYQEFGIDEGDIPRETLKTAYQRTQKEFFDNEKTGT